MKKIYIHMMMLAAMVVAGAAMTSCSKEEVATGKFKMSINATMAGGNSKALSIDGTTLKATWAVGEEVKVYNGATMLGTLTAQTEGESTTLDGTVTGTITPDDVLTLKFCSPNYTSQQGTLEYIAANCDYAEATVTVSSVGDGVVRTTESSAAFVNQQAIVKFTLTDNASTPADLNTSELVVAVPGTTITVTPASSTNVFYVAIPGISGQNVSLSAYKDYCYIYSKNQTGVTLNNGQYYEITARMTRTGIDLSRVPAPIYGDPVLDLTAEDGDIIIGTLNSSNCRVFIASGASVTLNNMTINRYMWPETAAMNCLGNATINLVGTNTLSTHTGPGIFVPSGSTLTIDGSGSLAATGGNQGAAIGATRSSACGNIMINGGTINATGDNSAGIGSGNGGGCGDITINGGDVTATGNNGAGIGGAVRQSCGNITINGGTVNAMGDQTAGIGSGYDGGCGTISITGGIVTATGGSSGAGIGSGNGGGCTSISITGGTVNASGGYGSAGIGSGNNSNCGNITITNAVTSVTATANVPGYDFNSQQDIYACCIGKGCGYYATCGTVTVGSKVYPDGISGENHTYTYIPSK